MGLNTSVWMLIVVLAAMLFAALLFMLSPKWWQRIWCRHDWDCISDVWRCTAVDVQYKCKKCGKVEGL